MKKVYRKYGIALALLMVFALLKVTLVPNLQHTVLYRPLKDGITTLGWVLVIYMGFWYLERRRWEKATPEERRDMERSGQMSATSSSGARRPTSPGRSPWRPLRPWPW